MRICPGLLEDGNVDMLMDNDDDDEDSDDGDDDVFLTERAPIMSMEKKNLNVLTANNVTQQMIDEVLHKLSSNLGKNCSGLWDEDGFGQPCSDSIVVSLETTAVMFEKDVSQNLRCKCPGCKRRHRRARRRYMMKRRIDGNRVCAYNWNCADGVYGGTPYCEMHADKAEKMIAKPVRTLIKDIVQKDMVDTKKALADLYAIGQKDPRKVVYIDTEWGRDKPRKRLYLKQFGAVDFEGRVLADWISKAASPQFPSPSIAEILDLRNLVAKTFDADSEMIEWSLSRCDYNLLHDYCAVDGQLPQGFPLKRDAIFNPWKAWMKATPSLKRKHGLDILHPYLLPNSPHCGQNHNALPDAHMAREMIMLLQQFSPPLSPFPSSFRLLVSIEDNPK